MMPGEFVLELYQGSSKTIFIGWKSTSGVYRSLAGCTFRVVGKKAKSDTTTTFSLTSSNGKASLDTSKGYHRLKLTFSVADTLAVPTGQGWYDVFVDFADGQSKCIISDAYNCGRRVATPNV